MAVFTTRRIRESAEGHTTINRRRVEIIFQRFAGVEGDPGIEGLSYRLDVGSGAIVIEGRTDARGRVEVPLAAGETARLEILGSIYEITLDSTVHPGTEMRGAQQRLTMLGYYSGPIEANATPNAAGGVNPNFETEKAILDFQNDNGLFADADMNNNAQTTIDTILNDNNGL